MDKNKTIQTIQKNIKELYTMLQVSRLTPQQDKELYAEIMILESIKKKAEEDERFVRNGGSLYGSYFS